MRLIKKWFHLLLLWLCACQDSSAEAMLQYFNTSWSEITRKIPELAEVGYSSLWLPPPTKGSGGLSVGYDMWDPFDIGSKDQRNTVRTRYGNESELLELVKIAHRFGIRVYFDNIMNHRAFDIPGYNESTSIEIYPGMVPEDFHLQRTQEGFYRKWDNTRDWNSAWQVQNLGLADLIDIAQEPGATNYNFGNSEGSTFPKIKFIRDLDRPEQYAYDKDGNYIGFGGLLTLAESLLEDEGNSSPSDADIKARAQQYLQNNRSVYEEYVEEYLNRAARWLIDRTKADGLRLDAVKHVAPDFFGATYGADKDSSNYGYLGQIQEQFNITRGYSDSNHRDTVFDTEKPRDDAMVFGEHLGEPPGYGPYFDSGMRLVDNPLRQQLNDRLGSPWNGLFGFDSPGSGGFDPALTVMHAQSHDNDYASRRELQHAMYFTRAGIGLLYTDGNYQAETLGESGGAFPRHANTSFLGQWDDPKIPNLLYIHDQFARGFQQGKWSDNDVVIFERVDKRENNDMSDQDGVTMLFMLNDDYSNGHGRNFSSSFPSQSGGSNAYLYNYSTYGGGFYKWASEIEDGSTIIPPGGYFIFSYKNPDPSKLWSGSGGRPITIYQDGIEVGTVEVTRKDGPNGDPDYHGDMLQQENRPIITNAENNDFSYTAILPRVTDGSDLDIVVRVDGSAENVMLKLDGGIDLNSSKPTNTNMGLVNTDPVNRDNPPGVSWDNFLGYEQATYSKRIHPELFAAEITGVRDITGSWGAETFTKVLGQDEFTITEGSGIRFTDSDTASFLYHNPDFTVTGDPTVSSSMYEESNSGIYIWAKTNAVGLGYKMYVYYTLDGSTPEGAGGIGRGSTKVVEMNYQHNDDDASSDWWKSSDIPAPSIGTTLCYKIGIYKESASSRFPTDSLSVERKTLMLTEFDVNGLDADSVEYYPHFDYASDIDGAPLTSIGLEEGYHVLRARAFLDRVGKASIYNTFTQSFYYDTMRTTGEIRFPENDGESIGGSNYGVVIRTDTTVEELWYRIEDSDTSNDDIETGAQNGNGFGFEPYIDTNQNGSYDENEIFEDLNLNGEWDNNIANNWVQATEVTPSTSFDPSDENYAKEWRFDYINIPATGNADIKVRMREVSSATYGDFDLDDASGHYTTLTRNVVTAGPNEQVFIAYPNQDLQIVDNSYIMKVYFSKSLADGLSESELINRFLISIGSTQENSNFAAQSRDSYSISYNETDSYHSLNYQLPNLYNDITNYDHKISVVFDQPSPAVDFEDQIIVRALPVSTPRIFIISPKEFGSDGRPYKIILPDVANPLPEDRQFIIQTSTNLDATNVELDFVNLRGSQISTPSIIESGNSKLWNFSWTGLEEGSYRFTATVSSPGGTNSTDRNASVIVRETTVADNNDADDDDDGLLDIDENTIQELPEVTSDQWTNADVHTYFAFGKSSPTSSDTDGDGLPDSLELGWRTSSDPPTDSTVDTDGDGYTNFIGDLDPPFYNTIDNYGSVPDIDSISLGGDRTRLSAGTVTDPTNPDSDNDGIPDGVEDLNRNGWVDGDGATLPTNFDPWLGRDWPDGMIGQSENWTETDPNNRDTDSDDASDGYGEDKNFNGRVDGDINNNRIFDTGEAWSETDPLNLDTDLDGLPDGWEINFGLDPLNNGFDSFRTADAADGNIHDGASGNPDTDSFTNLEELINGTDPTVDNDIPLSPPNSINIGSGTNDTTGYAVNLNEFTDWTIDDLIVLDEYEGDGVNNQGTDTYPAYDGFDSSRDLQAFYFRDGGADGNLYFRFDFYDLQAFAEEGNLDTYVVIDTGNTNIGESNLPDEIDTRTEMKWEAVIAIYQTDSGIVYLDTDPSNNTTEIGADLAAKGVISRDQNSINGFGKAYYNSDLDAMEISISRQALIDTGWNGNPDSLNFQVFTTRDGTQNDGTGLGDIGGRSDIRDSIYDDFIASAYFRDQSSISGDNSILRSWFGRSGSNDLGKRAKVALITHGNQPILAASEMHSRINNGSGSGYFRLLDAHQSYGATINLHITPTLASALQWARVDPSINKSWMDGPSINSRIQEFLITDQAMLFGTTFADQPILYAPDDFVQDSVNLANEILTDIYSTAPSNKVFWPGERLADSNILETIKNLGYTHTVVDQMRHFFKWFGRNQALGQSGYRINKVNDINLIPIHDFASGFRYQNHDQGLNLPLRELLSRRARSNTKDQMLCILSDWEDFSTIENANAYDINLRWITNRPWITLVKIDDIIEGNIDLSEPYDGDGDPWGTVDRGDNISLSRSAKDYIDHATQGDYDNWYYGQDGREEGLEPHVFEIRTETALSQKFGTIGMDGLANQSWNQVDAISSSNIGTKNLGRTVMHAAMFVTALHEQQNNNLSKFSTGDYIYPDSDYNNLADISKLAQSQIRHAAMYNRVDAWSASQPVGAIASAEDIDLDGESEYLLYNKHCFAVFEAIGGRCIAGFTRNHKTNQVYQVIGTQPAFPDNASEEEGSFNVANGDIQARRTSAFKDWFTNGDSGGSSQYVNTVYSVTAIGSNGWRFSSPDGNIVKDVSISESLPQLLADYNLPNVGVNKIYVRHGLSPNVWNLIKRGQYDLDVLVHDSEYNELRLTNRGGIEPITALLSYDSNSEYNPNATDDDPDQNIEWNAINMRNQALTEQIEVTNVTGEDSFSLVLSLENGATDDDTDGLPNWWERDNALNSSSSLGHDGFSGNPDGDQYNNFEEYVLGLDPQVEEFNNSVQGLVTLNKSGGFNLTFPTLANRYYQIWYNDNLGESWEKAGIQFQAINDNSAYTWHDDGSLTSPIPSITSKRFYKIEISR